MSRSNSVLDHHQHHPAGGSNHELTALSGLAAEDVVLLAEFDEYRGPTILKVCWPTVDVDNHDDCSPDLQAFVQQLLSINFQKSHASLGRNSSDGFRFDTDEVEVLGGQYPPAIAQSLVRYFTLHDIQARGFVRRMCLVYASRWLSGAPVIAVARRTLTSVHRKMHRANAIVFLQDLCRQLESFYRNEGSGGGGEDNEQAMKQVFMETFRGCATLLDGDDEPVLARARTLHDYLAVENDAIAQKLEILDRSLFDVNNSDDVDTSLLELRSSMNAFSLGSLRSVNAIMSDYHLDSFANDLRPLLEYASRQFKPSMNADRSSLFPELRLPDETVTTVLAFFYQHDFAKHIVYALLACRPVWLLGRHDQREWIERLVEGLRMFLPVRYRQRVILWVSTSEKQRREWKLLGGSVDLMMTVAERERSRVTTVDLANNMLIGPLYNGTRIMSMMNTLAVLSEHASGDLLLLEVRSLVEWFEQQARTLHSLLARPADAREYLERHAEFQQQEALHQPASNDFLGLSAFGALPPALASIFPTRRERTHTVATAESPPSSAGVNQQQQGTWYTFLGGQSRKLVNNANSRPLERARSVMDMFRGGQASGTPTRVGRSATVRVSPTIATATVTAPTAASTETSIVAFHSEPSLQTSKYRSVSMEGINERFLQDRSATIVEVDTSVNASGVFSASNTSPVSTLVPNTPVPPPSLTSATSLSRPSSPRPEKRSWLPSFFRRGDRRSTHDLLADSNNIDALRERLFVVLEIHGTDRSIIRYLMRLLDDE